MIRDVCLSFLVERVDDPDPSQIGYRVPIAKEKRKNLDLKCCEEGFCVVGGCADFFQPFLWQDQAGREPISRKLN